MSILDGKASLVIAHPGHELCIYGWLELAKDPIVFILTDGSGRFGKSRIGSTTVVLKQVGARIGGIYGSLTDLEVYSAILKGDFDLFIGLANKLARFLIDEKIDYVVGDSIEGYNPTHDICRLIINSAVERVKRLTGKQIGNLDFPVVGQPDSCPENNRDQAIRLRLSEEAFGRKIKATKGYSELASEVDAALTRTTIESFRLELLRPSDSRIHYEDCFQTPPFYEQYAERQVAAGRYRSVIRLRDHMLPIANALLIQTE